MLPCTDPVISVEPVTCAEPETVPAGKFAIVCAELLTIPEGSWLEPEMISVPCRFAIVWAELLTVPAGILNAPEIEAAIAFLASLADPDKVATDELIAWSVVVSDALNDAVAATSSASVTYVASKLLEKSSKLVTLPANDAESAANAPDTCEAKTFLAVDAEDEIVSKSDANKFLASLADPDKVATDELIVWSVVVSDADKLADTVFTASVK